MFSFLFIVCLLFTVAPHGGVHSIRHKFLPHLLNYKRKSNAVLRAKYFVAWMFFLGSVRKPLFLGEFVRFAVYACADAREIAVVRGEWKKILAVGERSLFWTSGVARKRRNACEMSLRFSVFFCHFYWNSKLCV